MNILKILYDKVEDMRGVVNAYDSLQDEIESHVVEQSTEEERDQELGLYDDWDNTLLDGLEDEEWDEDHALDQVMNNMVADMTEEEIQDIIDEDTPKELQEKPWWEGPVAELETEPEEAPLSSIKEDDMLGILEQEVDEDEINPTSVGSIVKEKGLINEDKLWDEAMAKKAKEDMELFIKKKNENK